MKIKVSGKSKIIIRGIDVLSQQLKLDVGVNYTIVDFDNPSDHKKVLLGVEKIVGTGPVVVGDSGQGEYLIFSDVAYSQCTRRANTKVTVYSFDNTDAGSPRKYASIVDALESSNDILSNSGEYAGSVKNLQDTCAFIAAF